MSEEVNDLTKKMNDFASKFDRVFSQFQISKTCNSLLRKRIIDLEQSSLDNAQYLRKKMIEISPVPLEVSNNELEGLVCKALSLTGNELYPQSMSSSQEKRKCHNQI